MAAFTATPRIASTIQAVAKAIKAKLADDGVMDPSRVFLSLQGDDETAARAMSDSFIKIFLEEFGVFQGAVTGGGNDLLVLEATFIVSLWWRAGFDVDFADDNYLLDPVQGMLARWDEVLESLQLYDPEDADGNRLLVEPMRLALWFRPRKPKPVASWGRLSAPFEVKIFYDFAATQLPSKSISQPPPMPVMTAPAFRASMSGAFVASSPIAKISLPAGTLPTDILICFLFAEAAPGGETFTAPPGWTPIAPQSFRNYNPLNGVGNDNYSVVLAGFWAAASTPNLTFSQSDATSNAGWNCLAFSNVNPATPVDAVGQSASVYGIVGGAGPTTCPVGALVTQSDKSLVLIAGVTQSVNSDLTAAGFTEAASGVILPAPTGDVLVANAPTSSAGMVGPFIVSDNSDYSGSTDSSIVLCQPFALRGV